MKTIIPHMIAVITLLASAVSYGQQEGLAGEYYQAVAKYFGVSDSTVGEIAKAKLPPVETPVVLYLASKANKPPLEIAGQRSEGDSWIKITEDIGLTAEVYYMMIAGEIKSKTFTPIFAAFSETPKGKWKDIQFSDEDIVNIVNLRFIGSHYDFSVFEIMTMKDKGHSFLKINNMVRLANEEKYRKEKLKKREEAKALKEKKESEDQ